MGCSTVSVNVPVMRPAEISLPGVNTVAIGPMSITDCAGNFMGLGVTGADTEAVIGMAYALDAA